MSDFCCLESFAGITAIDVTIPVGRKTGKSTVAIDGIMSKMLVSGQEAKWLGLARGRCIDQENG